MMDRFSVRAWKVSEDAFFCFAVKHDLSTWTETELFFMSWQSSVETCLFYRVFKSSNDCNWFHVVSSARGNLSNS